MAYTKQTWIDRIVADDTGEVLQPGTIVNATRMGHIEDGIAANDSAITTLKGTTSGVTLETLQTAVNDLVDDLTDLSGLQDQVDGFEGRIDALERLSTGSETIQALMNSKVDKEAGKGLSTNDYTNAAKAKVDDLPENPGTKMNNMVVKETGKGLSEQNFTTALKTKLEGAAAQSALEALITRVETLEAWKNAVLAGTTVVNIDG